MDTHPTETFKAMEKLVEKGLVRSIGVSNFNSAQMSDIVEKCKTKIATNQVECHAYLNQAKLLKFCKDKDIVLTAYRQARFNRFICLYLEQYKYANWVAL